MKISLILKQYIWMIETLRKHGKLSLAEINDLWLETDMSEGVDISRTTFNRHRDSIADIFGIDIECDRHDGNRYYIENEESLSGHTMQNWMFSTLAVDNVISESLSMQNRIMLEPIPYSGQLLKDVIEAMRKMRKVEILYHRYGKSEARWQRFDPYCIKLFKQRWYILGHFSREATKDERKEYGKNTIEFFGMFSLDRIEEFHMTEEKFVMPSDFSADVYFQDSFGVLAHDGTEIERIVLRAYGRERYYLNDLPLHHSQREIAHGEDYADFELYMKPTRDFYGAIISRGAQMKVLKPEWLADEVYSMLLDATSLYE